MKYSEELVDELCKNLAAGYRRSDAMQLSGISHETFHLWLKGEIPDDAYPSHLRKDQDPALWLPANIDTLPKKERKELRRKAEAEREKWLVGREEKKLEFPERIKKAEIANKGRSMLLIQNAAATSWQAAAWWLERKYADEFGQKVLNEHSGNMTLTHLLSQASDANLTEKRLSEPD